MLPIFWWFTQTDECKKAAERHPRFFCTTFCLGVGGICTVLFVQIVQYAIALESPSVGELILVWLGMFFTLAPGPGMILLGLGMVLDWKSFDGHERTLEEQHHDVETVVPVAVFAGLLLVVVSKIYRLLWPRRTKHTRQWTRDMDIATSPGLWSLLDAACNAIEGDSDTPKTEVEPPESHEQEDDK